MRRIPEFFTHEVENVGYSGSRTQFLSHSNRRLAKRDSRTTMEDEGFVDDGFIAETAWEYVGRYGGAALSLLCELAAAAERAGDALAAQTWRAIAEAAERILNGH
jgi:hypothetical protein